MNTDFEKLKENDPRRDAEDNPRDAGATLWTGYEALSEAALSPENRFQAAALGGDNCFLTGAGGTGKSTQLGDRMARGSLDAISKHLGVGCKNGDGKEFAGLWESDRASAEAYLRNDLDLTAKVAHALGITA